jgi:hypothetical protein
MEARKHFAFALLFVPPPLEPRSPLHAQIRVVIGQGRANCFQGFFTTIGDEVASKIVFVCSDMWEPYLKVNGEEPIMGRKVLGTSKESGRVTICSS